jgi:hypothetical protein
VSTYQEIWEAIEPWEGGQRILGDIVRFLMGRSVEATLLRTTTGLQVQVQLPMPVVDQIVIPTRLMGLFMTRNNIILGSRKKRVEKVGQFMLGRNIEELMLKEFNRRLAEMERTIEAIGEEPTLAEEAAICYGLKFNDLPKPSGRIIDKR